MQKTDDLDFVVLGPDRAPPAPSAPAGRRGSQPSSPLSKAILELPPGGFIFVPGAETAGLNRLVKERHEVEVTVRAIVFDGRQGVGIWKLKPAHRHATPAEGRPIDRPDRARLMAGR
jgi:hypothetical protein